MTDRIKILMAEDMSADVELVRRELERAGLAFDLRQVQTREEFLRGLDPPPDLIISDYTMPNFDGLTALRLAKEKCPQTPFIFVSGTLGEDHAVESLMNGAVDYVIKGNLKRLAPAVKRAMEDARLRAEHRRAEQALVESEARFRQLAEQAPVGILLLDASGAVTYANRYWRDIVELTPAEALNVKWREVLHPEDRDWVVDMWSNALRAKKDCVIECRQQSKSGRIAWVNSRAMVQRDAAGAVTGYIVIVSDITSHKLYEEKIARLSRIHSVLSGINGAIVRNRDRRKLFNEVCRIAVIKGNFRFARIALWDAGGNRLHSAAKFGEPIDAVVQSRYIDQDIDVPREPGSSGEGFRSMKPMFSNDVSTDPRMAYGREAYLRCGIRSIVILPLTVADQPAGLLILYSAVPDIFTEDEINLLEELAVDVSYALTNMQREERLNYLVDYDPLTGLPNAGLFQKRLGQFIENAARDGSPCGVAVMDIERFRHVNESLGRDAGDALLKLVADRLKLAVGPERHDRMARIGPNSFAAIISSATDTGAIVKKSEATLAAALGAPIQVAGEHLLIAMKTGVAIFPGDGRDAESLLRNAEAALKEAKNSGEKLVFYEKQLNAHVAQRLTLENRLRRAIEQEQFVLYYQPKVDLLNGNVGSVEALIRWNSPEAGLVPPAEFIPLLENTGLIYEVGRWAMSRALRDFAALRGRVRRPPRIAVNVSALQLRKNTFVADLHDTLRQAESDDHGLDLEITESLLMRDVEDNIRKLHAVREMKVGVAVDDFGTGYSSLSYIAKLPIDLLKIDRSFIIDMCGNTDDLTIVSAVISLAHALKLKVVAEGVETEAQAQMLRRLRCDRAQGYLFCKPLPLDALIERLAQSKNGKCLVLKPGNA